MNHPRRPTDDRAHVRTNDHGWLWLVDPAGHRRLFRGSAIPAAWAQTWFTALCCGHEKAIRFAYDEIIGKRLTYMKVHAALAKAPQVTDA